MYNSKIAGIGHYVPDQVVTNEDLMRHMDTTSEWIKERTGIEERRYADRKTETTSALGAKASRLAIERAGISVDDIDFIVFATLSPDYNFPGSGVLLQRHLGITKSEIGALDVRNQCSGFIYALSIADQFIKTGTYKNILVVGAEIHSYGLDFSTRGRNVTVIFGDGAGAVVLQPTEEQNSGLLTTKLHSDGTYAEKLALEIPGSHAGQYNSNTDYGFDIDAEFGGHYFTQKMIEDRLVYPQMEGQFVFKLAVTKFPEVIQEALDEVGLKSSDIDLLVPHQANLRISQFVQKRMGLSSDKVFNNIQKYGNTTAASIPIAMSEAWEQGKIKDGSLVCLAAFGSGFTWASALIRW